MIVWATISNAEQFGKIPQSGYAAPRELWRIFIVANTSAKSPFGGMDDARF
jgi:hypothetical protein